MEPFLNRFAADLEDCLKNGLQIKNRKIIVKLKCFICDSPARALVKGMLNGCETMNTINKHSILSIGTSYFNHCHGCQKCTIVGSYNKDSNTVTFPRWDAEPRTDESFRAKTDIHHHKITTPLINVPIDLVLDFPVGDALHLLHLGLMKRFIMGWRDGDFGYVTKWTNSYDVKMISQYLTNCKTPSEIHRKMRSLAELPRWKGTEYRTFLLYISIVILRNHLPPFYYEHFLLFYCAIIILNSEYFVKYLIEYADKMIKSFLEIFKVKYGARHFTSNLHNLSHLVDEVKRFGPLDKFDAYPFENKLQAIKKLVRQRKHPLAEIAKRLIEREAINEMYIKNFEKLQHSVIVTDPADFDCDDFRNYGTTYSVYQKVQFQDFKITNTDRDRWFLTKKKEIVKCEYIVFYASDKCYLYGSELREKQDFFNVPIASSTFFIYAAENKFKRCKMYNYGDIICKMVVLPFVKYGDDDSDDSDNEECIFDSVFIPLWHTLN